MVGREWLEAGAHAADLAPGTTFGRYRIVERLGAGGMGVVYAAHDPELGRQVALKVLRYADDARDPGGTRLLQEAQTLARLSHPNVVAIHDVGVHDGRVWLAMELITGQVMRAWLRERPRGWREVVAVMLAAGRGVAAAHAAGILHGDIKPDNIMIDDDGRVRVMDFGLARSEHVTLTASEPPGLVFGTPAYMSPEQLLGVHVDARSDLYALCVTTWEALYRTRPFADPPPGRLPPRPAPTPPPARRTAAPQWLRLACARGLADDPDERWPGVAAWLAALELGPSRARRRTLVRTLAGLGLIAAAAFVGMRVDQARRTAACDRWGASITTTWNDDVRTRLEAVVLASGLANASSTATALSDRLARQAALWRTTAGESCRDHSVRGTIDDATASRALWCLDERRMELAALIEALADGDGPALQRAVSAAADLPDVARCRAPARLALGSPPPLERRERVRDVLAALAESSAQSELGAYDRAMVAARRAHALAEAIAWPPLQVATGLRVGEILTWKARHQEAERTLLGVYFAGREAGAIEPATSAAIVLTNLVGADQARFAEGEVWARHAALGLRELGEQDGLLAADRDEALGFVRYNSGALTEAIALHDRVRVLREALLGADHPAVAISLANLANMHQEAGDLDQAAALHARALELSERTLGAGHPVLADHLSGLASVAMSRGRFAEAQQLYARAVEIREQFVGADHPRLASALNGLAAALAALDRDAEARPLQERALAIWERSLGSEHPRIAMGLRNLAVTRRKLGDLDQAAQLLERALEIQRKAFAGDDLNIARTLGSLALCRLAEGRPKVARPLFQQSLAIQERALGPAHLDVAMLRNNLALADLRLDHIDAAADGATRALEVFTHVRGPTHATLAEPLTILAEVALARGRGREAVALAERALGVLGDAAGSAASDARFALARALWADGGDRRRARALAEQALADHRAAPGIDERAVTRVTTWLASHTTP